MTTIVNQFHGDRFVAYHGDCVEIVSALPTASVDYSIYSPPFASLYTYSASDRDMGNSRSGDEFAEHYRYLVAELLRVTKPGRLVSVHCMQLPASKQHDGFIGLKDFRGELIRMHQEAGFIYHSEVVIWKDPVVAMQRTKALGLLYKQIRKDSAMCRQGIPDYLVTFRAPGVNPDPVTKTSDTYGVDLWQQDASPVWNPEDMPVSDRYADPVWMDINPSDTLQKGSAREHPDEKHICPLQLPVIRRAVRLWTNPGDVVLTPFGGIGSEGYESVRMGRRAVLAELKTSYYGQLVANMQRAEIEYATPKLFDVDL